MRRWFFAQTGSEACLSVLDTRGAQGPVQIGYRPPAEILGIVAPVPYHAPNHVNEQESGWGR